MFRLFTTLLAGALTLGATAGARADRKEPLPKELEGIGITEKLDNQVPLTLSFKDHNGKDVLLADYFKAGKPVLLTLNYSNCPMLCSIQLGGFVKALREMPLTAGDRFEIVTVSLDPNEAPERAKATHARYINDYKRPEAGDGWHFLVGSEANIKAVADAVGFGYGWNEERQEYMHAPAVMVLSPEGKVARYLYGIVYDPTALKFSLLEASEGKSLSTTEKLILYCFHYDAESGRYAPVARNMMRVGGGLFLSMFAIVLGGFFAVERKKKAAGAHSKADVNP